MNLPYLKRAALAVVAAVVGVVGPGMVTPAHAAPSGLSAQTVAANRAAAHAALLASLTTRPVRPAVIGTNFVYNGWYGGGGLGVIKDRDGSYVHGTYDAILPYTYYTDDYLGWVTTTGWYTGPGFCSAMLRSDDAGESWFQQLPDLGPGQHFIGGYTDYQVFPYAC